jgi:cell division protein FtsL
MNAAVRALTQGILVAGDHASPITISKQYLLIGLLFIAIMISSVSIVYVTDSNRHLFNDLEVLQQNSDNLNTQYGQLLLEQNTWSSPARVQQIAQQQMNMSLPAPQDVVMVRQ